MQGKSQTSWTAAKQAIVAGREKYAPIAALLAGTTVIMVCLGLIAQAQSASTTAFDLDEPELSLSHYIIDTDFLARCAVNHKVAMEQSNAVAPEIREAILKLVASLPPE